MAQRGLTGLVLMCGCAAAWPGAARAGDLAEHRPVLRYDSAEKDRTTSVQGLLGPRARLVDGHGSTIASTPRLTAGVLGARYRGLARRASAGDHLASLGGQITRDRVYGRRARGADGRVWLQYWLLYEDNPQDRGVVATGRHAGDWEFLQVGLGRRGRPERVTLAQHSWAESCSWTAVRREGGAVVAYPANGSHATYPRPGPVDRPFPDPTDRANGRGRRVRPAVSEISDRAPGWVSWPGRWGESRAGIVPGEQSSPRGPRFQEDTRWTDPSAYDRGARRCGTGAPTRRWLDAVFGGVVGVAAVAVLLVVRRRRRAPRPAW